MTLQDGSIDVPLEFVADIVANYVANNHVPIAQLPNLIQTVAAALLATVKADAPAPEAAPLVPAVPIKRSVTNDFIVCLEDGKSFKSLKRHLMTHYNLTPDDYRKKWGLPADYPMVAPAYAAARSALAKTMGLGRKAAVEAEPVPEADEAAPAAKGRRRKAKAEVADAA